MTNLEFYKEEIVNKIYGVNNLDNIVSDLFWEHHYSERPANTSLRCILDWLCDEHQILDKEEKEYLSAVIKPFRDEILYIVKHNALVEDIDYQYISIGLSEPNMSFPTFRKGTMYKGMELNKKYTLEELGL